AEHLSELEPDIAASQHDQMLGNLLQFHDGFVRQITDALEPRHMRGFRARPDVDEDSLALDHVVVDLKFSRCNKPAMPAIQMEIRTLRHLPFVTRAESQHDFV